MAERFEGKIVIVTGSASGIGEATARRLIAEAAARFTGRQDRE
jgi:meso-butanediol dehydrogenase/(S,S)-butanediol dehydrogenase/diacetyl reductase